MIASIDPSSRVVHHPVDESAETTFLFGDSALVKPDRAIIPTLCRNKEEQPSLTVVSIDPSRRLMVWQLPACSRFQKNPKMLHWNVEDVLIKPGKGGGRGERTGGVVQ